MLLSVGLDGGKRLAIIGQVVREVIIMKSAAIVLVTVSIFISQLVVA
jgi:hypothetical protein